MRRCLALTLGLALAGCATVSTWPSVAPAILPASVDLVREDGSSYCGGTVLDTSIYTIAATGRDRWALVLTATHCLRGEETLLVRQDAASPALPAIEIRRDEARDLALLAVRGVSADWRPVSLAEDVVLGAPVWVVGAMAGHPETVTAGIVSSRDWPGVGLWQGVPLYVTDAVAHGGNSGGGIFDARGRLVGVLVGGFRATPNFFIPPPVIAAFLAG